MSPITKNSGSASKVRRAEGSAGHAYRNSQLVFQTSGQRREGEPLGPYPAAMVGSFAGLQEMAASMVSPSQQQMLGELMNPIVDVFIS